MNRRHCAVASLVMTLGTWCAVAHGQATPSPVPVPAPAPVVAAPPAPVTVPQAAYTAPAANSAAIANFVTLNVANLVNDADPIAQGKARDALSKATMTAGAPALPEFQFEYGRALNNALSPKLDPKASASLRQRLNIAIVAANVASVANNATLQETTIKLINDTTEPVLMWGLKAAQAQVPLVMKVRVGTALPPLVAAIVPAVFKHPSGPVFEEAYNALNAADIQIMGELLKLWGNRLSQYQGKDAPDDPAVDRIPVFTLTTQEMWKTVLSNKKMQTDVMQMISDQLSVAAQWADKMADGDKHDQLIKLTQQCAGGCSVVGGHQNIKALVDAATPGAGLDPKRVPPGTKIVPVVTPIILEIPKTFEGVKPPPIVGGPAGE